jgi:hypothetical protein
MQSTDPKKPAFPRGVIRLLRSGSLDEARTRRVLENHDISEVEWLLRSANDQKNQA